MAVIVAFTALMIALGQLVYASGQTSEALDATLKSLGERVTKLEVQQDGFGSQIGQLSITMAEVNDATKGNSVAIKALEKRKITLGPEVDAGATFTAPNRSWNGSQVSEFSLVSVEVRIKHDSTASGMIFYSVNGDNAKKIGHIDLNEDKSDRTEVVTFFLAPGEHWRGTVADSDPNPQDRFTLSAKSRSITLR